MSKGKSALGGGIDSLISMSSEVEEGVTEVDINIVKPNPYQPRKFFSEESLIELSESIQSCGIIQPILVESNLSGGYLIIAGERRYRAAIKANLSKIPVIVKDLTQEEKLEIALVENIQRENLTPIEEAKAYKQLMGTLELSQEEVAKKVGKKRSTISNSLRLLKLPEDLQLSVDKGELSAGHARALLSIDDINKQRSVFDRIKKDSLSVRATEKLVSEDSKEVKNQKNVSKDPTAQFIEQKFIDYFGTKVQLKGSMKKGKIEINYLSKDDLDRFLDLIS